MRKILRGRIHFSKVVYRSGVNHVLNGQDLKQNEWMNDTCCTFKLQRKSNGVPLSTPRTWAPPEYKHKRSSVGTNRNFTYVVVFKGAQHLQLAKCPLRRSYVLENIRHFFESHSLAGAWISDRPRRNPSQTFYSWIISHVAANTNCDRLKSRPSSLTTQPRRRRSRSACRETCFAMLGKLAKYVAESRTWSEAMMLPPRRRCKPDSCTVPSLEFEERVITSDTCCCSMSLFSTRPCCGSEQPLRYFSGQWQHETTDLTSYCSYRRLFRNNLWNLFCRMPRASTRCSLGRMSRHAIGRDVWQMFQIPKVEFLAFSKLLRFRWF